MANIFENTFGSKDFKESISNIAKDWALPALLATAGTGAIGGYLASRNRIGHETPNARRKRILRSALFPAATTAAALAALGGTAALGDVDTDKFNENGLFGLGIHPVDFLAKNALIPLGAAAGGLASGAKIGMPEGKGGTSKALFRFNVGEDGKIKSTAKGLKNEFIKPKTIKNFLLKLNLKPETIAKINKNLPRVVTKGSPLSTALWIGAGALGGAVADEAVNTVLY